MTQTVAASFETRREADMFVEHLVQEYGVNPNDIRQQPATEENSAGTEPGDADADAGSADGAALEERIVVSAQVHEDVAYKAIAMIESCGGQRAPL